MSFILDALRKSESDRQQQDAIETAFVATQTTSSSNTKWFWLVAALVLVNAAALLYLFLNRQPSSTEHAESISETITVPVETPVVEAPVRELPTVTENAVESSPTVTMESEIEQLPVESEAMTEPTIEAPPEVTSAPPIEPSTNTIAYQTFTEVRASGQVQLPELRLDMHVYSGAPAERFVFINMSKQREGSTLDEGPRVVEIVPDGVVLEHDSVRFLLTRN